MREEPDMQIFAPRESRGFRPEPDRHWAHYAYPALMAVVSIAAIAVAAARFWPS